MKRILLATVAAAALSFPALAQDTQSQTQQPDQMNQSDMQTGGQSGNYQEQGQGAQNQPAAGERQASQRLNPLDLSKDQVSRIQQALNQNGFDTQSDGIWGPQTASALRKFQDQNKIDANGHLTQQTLAQLGVNWSGQKQPETVGSGAGSMKPNGKANTGDKNGGQPSTTGSGSMNSGNTNNKQPDQNGMSSGQSGTSNMDQGASGATPMNKPDASGASDKAK